jgi:hypothetical protein
MGKNGGGQPTEAILTLEDALMRFKRKRDEAGEQTRSETVSEGNVHYINFSATVEHEHKAKATTYLESAFESASVSAQHDESNAGTPAEKDIVAVIDGIPRTLDDLERLAAAEKAYDQDFPETTLESAEVEDDDVEAGEMDVMAHEANRHAMMRDYAFTAMGTALMVLVAVLVMHVPIVNDNHTTLMAQSIATPALKASSSTMSADDVISTLVITVPDGDVQQASAQPVLKSDQLEARIRDTLKLRAFPDIGVPVRNCSGPTPCSGESVPCSTW